MRRTMAILSTALLASACDARADPPAGPRLHAPASGRTEMSDSAMTESDRAKAIAAGREYVKQKFPDFSEDRKTPVVTDAGADWQFTYQLPVDMLGGAPVVLLSKKDLSVTKAYRTQ